MCFGHKHLVHLSDAFYLLTIQLLDAERLKNSSSVTYGPLHSFSISKLPLRNLKNVQDLEKNQIVQDEVLYHLTA